MSIVTLAFLLFALSALAGGLLAVLSRDAGQALVGLGLAVLSLAGLLVQLGAAGLGLLMIVVFAGALAGLWTFAVKVGGLDLGALRAEITRQKRLIQGVAVFAFVGLSLALGVWQATLSEGEAGRLTEQYTVLLLPGLLTVMAATIGAVALALRLTGEQTSWIEQFWREQMKAKRLKPITQRRGEG